MAFFIVLVAAIWLGFIFPWLFIIYFALLLIAILGK